MTSIFGINLFSEKSSRALPPSIATENSVELCLNSRLSYHEGWSGAAQDKWLSNVLWAAGCASIIGNRRDIYATLSSGRFLYNPENHSLTNRKQKRSSTAAFIVSNKGEKDFDAGVAYMFAMLASVSLWNGTGSQLASCPVQENLYFGIRDVRGLTSDLAVTSSDGSLPDPRTHGDNSIENVLAHLKITDNFIKKDITLEDLSQILWAGYGCTPHITYNGHSGLTVPSWCAEYYLTGNIYVINQDGAHRYHNRNPNKDLTTKDHRLEQIQKGGDNLQSIVRELPDAPCYILLCLDSKDLDKWYARLETGFAGGNMLLQGSAMGIGCYFTRKLTGNERRRIQEVIGLETKDIPFVIISLGYI